MPLVTTLYRLAKHAVDAAPPWLLRVRPYGVYSISLGGRADDNATPAPPTGARWAKSRAEVQRLSRVASRVNLDRWDGESCRVAYAVDGDGTPVGAAWIDTGRFAEPELGVAIDLSTTEAWLHSAYVRPEHRRVGVYTRMLSLVRDTSSAEGLERLLLGVTLGNTPSRVAHEQNGAERVGRLLAARVVGVRAASLTGGVTTQSGKRLRIARRDITLRVHAGSQET
ncbi:MAG: GNAT family N-acetyltransferase [Planctomycetota bacterium]